MHTYKNLSQQSGVAEYEYDTQGFSCITVKFKDGSIYSYTVDTCGATNVFEMIQLAQIGRGLNRHINFYDPGYILGRLTSADLPSPTNVTSKNYPSLTVKSIKWDGADDPTWIRIEYKNGQTTTYTVESAGAKNIAKLVELAQKGYGLLAFIKKEQPQSVDDVTQ